MIIRGIGQIPEDAHLLTVTMHCPRHPSALLYGWATYNGVNRLALGPADSHGYIGHYEPTDEERQRVAEAGVPASFAVAPPKPGQAEHWHYSPSCAEIDTIGGQPRRCPYHVRLAARDSQMVEFVKGLWVRRSPSLEFYNIGPFLEDLGRQQPDGMLAIFDQLGADGFVRAVNRNRHPESPICRVALRPRIG